MGKLLMILGSNAFFGLLLLYFIVQSGNIANKNMKLEKEISVLQDSLEEQVKENHKLKSYYKAFYVEKQLLVSVTGYHPVRGQTDSTPNITADGTKIDISSAGEYRYVALSRDLLKRWGGRFNYGDLIYIKGMGNGYDGIYQVRDTMHPRHENWVDILLTPGETSFYKKNILMYKVNVVDRLAFIDLFGEK